MFLYTSNRKFPSALSLYQVSSDDNALIVQAAQWAEEKWGYIRQFKGVEDRLPHMAKLTHVPDLFFMLMCGSKPQPIGMFALRAWKNESIVPNIDIETTVELDYFFVEESFRGLGVGSHMMKLAKQAAAKHGKTLMTLQTMEPRLNQFYERHGAVVLCEHQYKLLPTDRLRIKL